MTTKKKTARPRKPKRSRREISAGVLQQLGMAGPNPDVQLNADFEQALRDRGRKRNELRKEFLGQEPIDEELAGVKAIEEERSMVESYEREFGKGAVVINRRTRSKTKGAKSQRRTHAHETR